MGLLHLVQTPGKVRAGVGGSGNVVLPRVSFAPLAFCFAETEDEDAWTFTLDAYVRYLGRACPELQARFQGAGVCVTDFAPGAGRAVAKYAAG
eukprot:4985078-Lingulodinium_polyedra.AAC.1